MTQVTVPDFLGKPLAITDQVVFVDSRSVRVPVLQRGTVMGFRVERRPMSAERCGDQVERLTFILMRDQDGRFVKRAPWKVVKVDHAPEPA